MASRVTIRDVAARARVSVGTVSNVVNGSRAVSPETEARVRAAIEELGFVRHEGARLMRSGRGRTLGLVVMDVSNPFFTDIARGVEDEANRHGLAVILCNSDADPGKEDNYLELLEEHQVAAVIMTPVYTGSPRLADLHERGTHVVFVDAPVDPGIACSVSADDRKGGALAAGHLFDLGHERLAYVGAPARLRQSAERLEGARAEAEKRHVGGDRITAVFTEGQNVAAGFGGGQVALDIDPMPTAILCTNDLLALGVLQVALERGVRVPDDLSIVGYDDIDFASAGAIPLTSVRQPRHRMGVLATELAVQERGDAAHSHQRLMLRPELIIRRSTGPV